jgi:hypothetical protein
MKSAPLVGFKKREFTPLSRLGLCPVLPHSGVFPGNYIGNREKGADNLSPAPNMYMDFTSFVLLCRIRPRASFP